MSDDDDGAANKEGWQKIGSEEDTQTLAGNIKTLIKKVTDEKEERCLVVVKMMIMLIEDDR